MKRKIAMFALLTLVAASGCLGGSSASDDPIEDMQVTFEGDHDYEEIKRTVDGTLQNFGMEANDENRRELGNIAYNVAYDKDWTDSMMVLSCMSVMPDTSEFGGDTPVERLESAAVFCGK
jgi:hypothetical protein